MSELALKTTTIELSGKEYTFTETTLSDITAFRNHIRSYRLRAVMDASMGCTTGERVMMIAEIQKQVISDEEVFREMATIEGMIYMAWRSLLHVHPDITLEYTAELLGRNRDSIQDVSVAVNSLGTDESVENSGKKKAQGRKESR